VQSNWRPLGWLRFNSTTGLDVLSRADGKLFPVGGVTLDSDYENGQRFANRFRLGTYTANLTGTAQFNLLETLISTTSASFQYQRDISEGTSASGFALTAGSETLGGASTRFAVDESYLDNRLAGGLLQQQIGWRDRLFLTGGIRGDDNSAFGTNFSTAYYPTAQLSWVISEESFFPQARFLNSLQLRSSYGQSGLRPGNRDARVYFNAAPVRLDSAEASGVTLGGIGDPNLKPERTSEYELGFVATGIGSRVTLDATYYAKRSRDALISRRTAPSAGVASSVFANLGAVENRGFEVLLNTRPVDRPSLTWNVTLNYSQNRDKLLDLGQDVSGQDIPPIITGSAPRSASSRATRSRLLGPRITELRRRGRRRDRRRRHVRDSAEFMGRSAPSQLFSLNTDAASAASSASRRCVDYRGGTGCTTRPRTSAAASCAAAGCTTRRRRSTSRRAASPRRATAS
jgi:outer membrane receptor protein involved in Fe transport